MEAIVEELKKRLNAPGVKNADVTVRRIVVKDALIPYFLKFIYDHKTYRRLAFYGGSCARVVYGLNRMSEDIDLDNSARMDMKNFRRDLTGYIRGSLRLTTGEVYAQSGPIIRRWTVRLPLLFDLGLSKNSQEKLHVKLEVSPQKQTAVIAKTPVVVGGNSMVITHWDQETLMAGKMIACLERHWRRGISNKTMIKGRDYYDLLWYLQRRVVPNEAKLAQDGKKPYTIKSAIKALDKKIKAIKPVDVKADLLPLFPERVFVEEWVKNFKDWFSRLTAGY